MSLLAYAALAGAAACAHSRSVRAWPLRLRGAGAGEELSFPRTGLDSVDDAVVVAAALRRPLQLARGVHRCSDSAIIRLSDSNERLILAGADPPPKRDAGQDLACRPEESMPAVVHGRWCMSDASSGALCDGVCLISRRDDDTREREPVSVVEAEDGGKEGVGAEKSTLRVMSGPWYLDHVRVWAHGCTAMTVERSGLVFARCSGFGGEAAAGDLCAQTAVHCKNGTASVTLKFCTIGNTTGVVEVTGEEEVDAGDGVVPATVVTTPASGVATGATSVQAENGKAELSGENVENDAGGSGWVDGGAVVEVSSDDIDNMSPEQLYHKLATHGASKGAERGIALHECTEGTGLKIVDGAHAVVSRCHFGENDVAVGLEGSVRLSLQGCRVFACRIGCFRTGLVFLPLTACLCFVWHFALFLFLALFFFLFACAHSQRV